MGRGHGGNRIGGGFGESGGVDRVGVDVVEGGLDKGVHH